MKRRLIFIGFIFFISYSIGFAQKNDYVWLSGYDSNVGYDPHWGFYFGTSKLNFNFHPRQVDYDSLGMSFAQTNTSFCDSDGNLLFYTNGIYVANALDEKIENSDSLNAGYFQYVLYPATKLRGYRNPQGVLAIPSVATANQYFIIHSWEDSFQVNIICKRTLLSVLDMNLNGGHGRVLLKNEVIVDDLIGSELVATKHANGRDWWVLVQKRNSNCYFRILIDSSGVHQLSDVTCGGSVAPFNDDGAACFSTDGTKYAYFGYYARLSIMDFDRCSGELSNPISIQLPVTTDGRGWGISSSPNSRFLYVSFTGILYQFDLWAQDIAASIDTIGIFDGTEAPFSADFHTHQLGPDGKIYISCGNADTVYHVIERPDEKGDSCMFRQHSLNLPSPSAGVPNFPNYRLGALPGSPCDTLTGLNDIAREEKEKLLKVFPNPATNFVTVDYGFTDWNKGEVSLEITNELGQVVHQQAPPMYSGFQKIEVQNFAPGMYTAFIKRKGQVVGMAKFAKQ